MLTRTDKLCLTAAELFQKEERGELRQHRLLRELFKEVFDVIGDLENKVEELSEQLLKEKQHA
jgi:Mg2+ and Co2+ transporter CorA